MRPQLLVILALGLMLLPAGPIQAQAAAPQSLSLADAQSEALRLHPTLDEYRSRIQQARYRVDEAYVVAYPTAQVQSSYTYLNPTQTSTFLNQTFPVTVAGNYNIDLSLRWALHTFGRLKWGTLAAELAERTAQEEYRRELLRAWEEVTLAYYDLAQHEERLRVAHATVALQRQGLADAQAQEEAGMVAHFDVLRSEAALSQSQQNLLLSASNREVSRSRLANLLNRPPGFEFRLQDVPTPPGEVMSLEQALEFALVHRPDMQALDWSVQAAEAQVGLAASQDAPTLAVQSDYVTRTTTQFTFGQLGRQWSSGLVLTIPLFDGGAAEARTNQARETVRQLRDNRDNLRRQVRVEVESLFHEQKARWQQIEVAQAQVVQAVEGERVAVLRYNSGLGTQLERLDSQRQRTLAEEGLISARYQYLGLLARWHRSMGREVAAPVSDSP